MELSENLKPKDLKYLVDTYVSIDQYTSKLDSDNITIAFYCNEKEAADDLSDFIEKMYFTEIRDIEISDTLTKDNQYIVYIEFERNDMFPKTVIDIVDSVSYLTDNKDWTFETIDVDGSYELNEDNIRKYVRLEKYIESAGKKEEKVKESVQYSKDNLTRTYLDEGYISEEDFNKYIDKCENLNENTLDKEIVEYNLPGNEVITADNKIFVVGDKIKMFESDTLLEKDVYKQGFEKVDNYNFNDNLVDDSYKDYAVNQDMKQVIGNALSTLSPREERVLRYRFGINLDKEYDLGEIAQMFGVSRQRILQIIHKALRKLKHPSRSKSFRSYIYPDAPLPKSHYDYEQERTAKEKREKEINDQIKRWLEQHKKKD